MHCSTLKILCDGFGHGTSSQNWHGATHTLRIFFAFWDARKRRDTVRSIGARHVVSYDHRSAPRNPTPRPGEKTKHDSRVSTRCHLTVFPEIPMNQQRSTFNQISVSRSHEPITHSECCHCLCLCHCHSRDLGQDSEWCDVGDAHQANVRLADQPVRRDLVPTRVDYCPP